MAVSSLDFSGFIERAISPVAEMGAYEALWRREKASFKQIADLFRNAPGSIPSDFVTDDEMFSAATEAMTVLRDSGVERVGIRVNGAGDYPEKLRDARNPLELLYYRGDWELAEVPSVAIVGTRKPTEEGVRRTKRLVKALTDDGFTITSGLAAGIDVAAHEAALALGQRTIAVIGTSLASAYPKPHFELQEHIANKHLLISQVPILRYREQDWRANRGFFPERNATMSALTQATIIVEAGETSGTLIQARAALFQGRRLFILNSCFENPALDWPAKFEAKGAVRVRHYDDIREHLVVKDPSWQKD